LRAVGGFLIVGRVAAIAPNDDDAAFHGLIFLG